MSTAKMVADSTVSSELLGERRKRRKSGTNKHSKRTRKYSKDDGKGHRSEDSDSDLDLEKDLKTIGGYMKDRREMLDNMFSAVKGSSLKRALPDILLDLPLEELKQRCLEQLEIMSKKRIRRIIEGANPADISSSSTEDSSGEEKAESVEIESLGTGEEIEEEIEYIEVEEEVEVTDFEEEASVTKEEDGEAPSGEESVEEMLQKGESESESDGQSSSENASADEAPSKMIMDEEMSDSGTVEERTENVKDQGQTKVAIAPILTKDQMEILELEMRARAIKAMLNKQPKALSNAGESTTSNDRETVVKLDSKTAVSNKTKDKSDPPSTGIDQKLQDVLNEEHEVTTGAEITDPKKKLKRKHYRIKKDTIEAHGKGKMLETVSGRNEDSNLKEVPEAVASKESSDGLTVEVDSVSSKEAAVIPDNTTINQSSTQDPIISDSAIHQKSSNVAPSMSTDISNSRQTSQTSEANERPDSGTISKSNDAESCQEDKEVHCGVKTESICQEKQTKETLSGVDSKETESRAESKEAVNDATKVITFSKSMSDKAVLNEGESDKANVKVSSGLPEKKPMIAENIGVDSSDTEEGEVTSANDDN